MLNNQEINHNLFLINILGDFSLLHKFLFEHCNSSQQLVKASIFYWAEQIHFLSYHLKSNICFRNTGVLDNVTI